MLILFTQKSPHNHLPLVHLIHHIFGECEHFFSLFLKMGQPRPLFCLLLVFSNKRYKFYNKLCEKCRSSIPHWDSNSQPSDYDSPPLTTRPGLLPTFVYFYNSGSEHFRAQIQFYTPIKVSEAHAYKMGISRPL